MHHKEKIIELITANDIISSTNTGLAFLAADNDEGLRIAKHLISNFEQCTIHIPKITKFSRPIYEYSKNRTYELNKIAAHLGCSQRTIESILKDFAE